MAASDPSPRGHLIVKSHSPLPRFACAVPVPHPDAKIDKLRTTIVAILTGQVSAKVSSSSSNGNGSSHHGGAKGEEAPLSYSEHLKQLTIHEWRMKSLILELRQNSLIAPETRGAAEEEGGAPDEGVRGFELLDDHDCSLLEHGDEVNLWLRPGQEFESLRLTKLSSKHVYGLPNQPALDRSGTMLLGDNAASTPEANSDFTFQSPALIVREPMEPSSHSSSVSANPDINFETTNRHWTVPNQSHRVVTVQQLSAGNNMASATRKQPVKRPSREKPKRLNSGSYFSPQLVEQKQKEKHHAPQRSRSGPIATIAAGSPTTKQSPEAIAAITPLTSKALDLPTPKSSALPSLALSPRAILSPDPANIGATHQSRQSSQPSSPVLDQNEAIATQLKARQAAYIRAEKQERDSKSRKPPVDQKRMPAGALIVGPGVQGKVGHVPPSGSQRVIPDRKPSGSEDRGEGRDVHRNRDAFAAFTAASSEAYKPVRPHAGKTRRQSSRSEVSDKEGAERADTRRPSERRQSSFGKMMERKQSETSIRKAEKPPVVSRSQSQSQILLQPLLQPLVRPSTSKASTPASAQIPAPAITVAHPAPSTNKTTGTTPAPAPGPTRRFLDILPPMAMPKLMRTGSLGKSWQDLLQPLSGPFTPQTPSQILASPIEEKEAENGEVIASPIDVHRSLALQEDGPSSSSQFQDTASSQQQQESIFSTPMEEEAAASLSSSDAAATASLSTQPLSKAEKRYQEVMKAIEGERERQALDEKLRREDALRREADKAKANKKLQEDQEKRKETLKWQMWEEVKARQEMAKDKPRRR